MNKTFRSQGGRIRFAGCALLLIAAMLPVITCEEKSKSRMEDGSLTFNTVQREHYLWQEISEDYRLIDTFLIVLAYSWPVLFLLFRASFSIRKTRKPLGVAESAVGCFFLLLALVNTMSPCWSIFGESKPHVASGSYLAITGNVLYLVAWPLEKFTYKMFSNAGGRRNE